MKTETRFGRFLVSWMENQNNYPPAKIMKIYYFQKEKAELKPTFDRLWYKQCLKPNLPVCSAELYQIYLPVILKLRLLAVQFIEVLEKELDAVEKDKETFIRDFSEVYMTRFSVLPSIDGFSSMTEFSSFGYRRTTMTSSGAGNLSSWEAHLASRGGVCSLARKCEKNPACSSNECLSARCNLIIGRLFNKNQVWKSVVGLVYLLYLYLNELLLFLSASLLLRCFNSVIVECYI